MATIAFVEPGAAIGHVSLDHDLDPSHYGHGLKGEPIDRAAFGAKTGFAVLEWMAETGHWALDISIHTLNPRGAADMLELLKRRAPAHVKFRRVWPGEI